MDFATIVYGYLERETITGELRTRLFHCGETLTVEDPCGEVHRVEEGAVLLVVDRSRDEQPLVEQLVDGAELYVHFNWGSHHDDEETRTPLDLRTPEAGGRETPPIPF